MKPSFFRLSAILSLAALAGCGSLNDSWEVKGGGYIKYRVDGKGDYTIELSRRDVEIPYVRNSHHYLLIKSQLKESKRGDQFSIMVNRPVTGDNHPVSGRYSWFIAEKSEEGVLLADKSIVDFDERSDTLWTADLDLYAIDCRSGKCLDSLPPLHITGRFRYWIAEEDR